MYALFVFRVYPPRIFKPRLQQKMVTGFHFYTLLRRRQIKDGKKRLLFGRAV